MRASQPRTAWIDIVSILTTFDAGWQAGAALTLVYAAVEGWPDGEVALWRRLAAEFAGSAFLAAP